MFGRDAEGWKKLAQSIQDGEAASEDEFARIFYPHILAMVAGRLHDRETAREITQDVLLGVLKALREKRLRESEKLPAFVVGTARNLINNFIERQVQQRDLLSQGLNKAMILGQSTKAREPEIEDEERRKIVRAALRKLKPADYRILFLTLVEGLSPREIALEMGMKPENIRNRKSRALKIVQRKVRRMIRKGGRDHINKE